MNILKKLLHAHDSPLTIIVRLIVGPVFFFEGIQKFLYPADLGYGRFAKIGLPSPEILAPFVGGVETVAGACVLLGLFTRPAAFLLATIMMWPLSPQKFPF